MLNIAASSVVEDAECTASLPSLPEDLYRNIGEEAFKLRVGVAYRSTDLRLCSGESPFC